jgi:hypothetical protein
MTQHQTSTDSYKQLDLSKTASEREAILNFLASHAPLAFCDREISVATKLPINIAESRRCDLARSGKIVYAGVMHDNLTNRTVRTWKTKP